MLVDDLHQQIVEIHRLGVDGDLLGVVAGDLKKFGDHFLQPPGFFQRDVYILGPLLRRQLRHLLQQIQVSQHGGQRGADVVSQIQNQLILPLLRGPGRPLPLIQDAPHRVQFAFKRFHLRRELDLLRLLRQKAVNSLVDLPEVSGHPAEQVPQHQQKDQDDGHAEEDLLVAAEVVMVEVKRLLMGDIQPPLHQPDHQIPAPAFP